MASNNFYTFLVDDSGSMGGSKLESAKTLTGELFDEVRKYAQIRLVRFANETTAAGPYQQYADTNWLRNDFFQNSWTANGGGTALWGSLYQMCVEINELQGVSHNETFSLVIVTDGDDNSSRMVHDCKCHGSGAMISVGGSTAGCDMCLKFIADHKLDVAIYILGIGDDCGGQSAANFEKAAKATGGKWKHAKKASQDAIKAVIDEFKSAVISMQPPSNVSAVQTGTDNTATVTWTPPVLQDMSAIVGYGVEKLDCSTTGNHAWTPVNATIPSGSTQHIVQGLAVDSTYQFRVVALLAGGKQSTRSAPSNPVKVEMAYGDLVKKVNAMYDAFADANTKLDMIAQLLLSMPGMGGGLGGTTAPTSTPPLPQPPVAPQGSS